MAEARMVLPTKAARSKMRFMVELFCLVLFPVEVVLEDEADTFNHGSLTERVLIDGVGISFQSQFAIRCE